MPKPPCHVTHRGSAVDLVAPAFRFQLDAGDALRALSWENRLTAEVLALGKGLEFGVDLDSAERRVWVLGWRGMDTGEGHAAPHADPGYRAGFHRTEFDDSKWPGHLNPPLFWESTASQYYWVRTHVFLPPACRGRPLALVLGNLGLFDFRFMRVFINGRRVGDRHVAGRWHEPGVFDLGPSTPAHRAVRFGQENILAVQMSGPIRRTARLDEADPRGARHLPFINHYAPAFEQYFVVERPVETPAWRVAKCQVQRQGRTGEVVVKLSQAGGGLAARVTYRWSAGSPCLHKWVEIENATAQAVRVMSVRLGSYQTGAEVSEGEQGFPVYLNDDRFITLAHPAGWAMGEDGHVELRQYPGKLLHPGESFACMEAVLGVAPAPAPGSVPGISPGIPPEPATTNVKSQIPNPKSPILPAPAPAPAPAPGRARRAFLDHLQGRMRRVRRGHDAPQAIFEPFGSWPIPEGAALEGKVSERILLDNIAKVAHSAQRQGCRFDYYSLEFWADPRGDLLRPHADTFPAGLGQVLRAIRAAGMKTGLWLDNWSLCDNPVISPSRAGDVAWHSNPEQVDPPHVSHFLCFASEPMRTLHATALVHHLDANAVRLLKFDSLRSVCYNPEHDHLPGLYSTEAIYASLIDLFAGLDRRCPEVFLMLYWGYRSPWWLLHADTMFEMGLAMEASSPAPRPTLFARDGVTQGIDQAQHYCQDVPRLGRDPLGIWLSDWPWNSCVGKERWQEGMVMDLCRGHLMIQPWSDHRWLTPAERRQMADFLALLRARPECFRHSHSILGNPWENQPYGYCCTDGRRAFVAIHNCAWRDAVVELELSPAWGLADAGAWDVYRWYPSPARLSGGGGGGRGGAAGADAERIALRPFDVVLLEVVPRGEAPTLDRRFVSRVERSSFAEPTVDVALATRWVDAVRGAGRRAPTTAAARQKDQGVPPQIGWDPRLGGAVIAASRELRVTGLAPASRSGGTLVLTAEQSKEGMAYQGQFPDRDLRLAGRVAGKEVRPVPALHGKTYPTAWQTWRIPVAAGRGPQPFELVLTVLAPLNVELLCQGYFIPLGERQERQG